jgi:hypothetical protein
MLCRPAFAQAPTVIGVRLFQAQAPTVKELLPAFAQVLTCTSVRPAHAQFGVTVVCCLAAVQAQFW